MDRRRVGDRRRRRIARRGMILIHPIVPMGRALDFAIRRRAATSAA